MDVTIKHLSNLKVSPCFEQEVGPHNIQTSLSAYIILWFYFLLIVDSGLASHMVTGEELALLDL